KVGRFKHINDLNTPNFTQNPNEMQSAPNLKSPSLVSAHDSGLYFFESPFLSGVRINCSRWSTLHLPFASTSPFSVLLQAQVDGFSISAAVGFGLCDDVPLPSPADSA
ncbi:hypothetical protein PIB30_061271, partial [Stylosanthes scabra]|nr:hypothetical protein [Stylosanthes scabra]